MPCKGKNKPKGGPGVPICSLCRQPYSGYLSSAYYINDKVGVGLTCRKCTSRVREHNRKKVHRYYMTLETPNAR